MAQAPLAQELKKLFAAEAFGPGRKGDAFREESRRFFVNYLKQVAQVFGAAWNGRKYSIKSATALARVHPGRAGRRAAARSGARGPHRLPRDRPGHRAVGPTDRRPPLRNRRRLEAIGHDNGGIAGEGAAVGAAVSRRSGRLRRLAAVPSTFDARLAPAIKKGIVRRRCPAVLRATRLPSNSRLPAVNIQAACTHPIEQVVYRMFYCVFSVCTHC